MRVLNALPRVSGVRGRRLVWLVWLLVPATLTACTLDSERSLVLGWSQTLRPEVGDRASTSRATFTVEEALPCPDADVILATEGQRGDAVVTLEYSDGPAYSSRRDVPVSGFIRVKAKCPEGAELRRIRVASVLINPNGRM